MCGTPVPTSCTETPEAFTDVDSQRVMQLSKEDMHVVMDMVDVDKDGVCSLDDFRNFVHKHLERSSSKAHAAP